MTTDIFQMAKDTYSISDVWQACRLDNPPAPGTKICRSPFREDRSPSFSITPDGKLWKDHGTGEGGDLVSFLMRALDIDAREARLWFAERLGIDVAVENGAKPMPRPAPRKPAPPPPAEKRVEFPGELVEGTEAEWKAFATRRGLTFPAVHAMVHAGILRFIEAEGVPCYCVTDEARRAAEIRRIDGEVFRGGTKTYPLRGVDKSWLPGAAWLREVPQSVSILICEGATDFLAAWNAYAIFRRAGGTRSWLPLAVLGASCRKLHPDLALYFRHRLVRIAADGDEAGRAMAKHWGDMLTEMGCEVEVMRTPQGRDLRDMLESGTLEPQILFL